MAASNITVTLDASKVKAILDLAKEYCKDNLVELVKEWLAMQDGRERGPCMDELLNIVRDYWPVHSLALAGDLIRNAAFERVLELSE